MAVFHAIGFFTDENHGWTEGWYTTAGDLATVKTRWNPLINQRLQFSPFAVACQAVRITKVEPFLPRVSDIFAVNKRGDRDVGSILFRPDLYGTASLVDWLQTDGSHKRTLIRGLADDDVVFGIGGNPEPSPFLKTSIDSYGTVVGGQLFGFRVQDSSRQKVRVFEVSAHPTRTDWTLLTVADVGTTVAGDKIRIFKPSLKVLPWLKGVWNVEVVDDSADTLAIAYPYNLIAPTFPASMQYQRVSYLYTIVETATWEDFRTRKTGRPTLVSRGRSVGVRFRR